MKSFWKTGKTKMKRTTADNWFSKYIRLRDVIDGSNGFFRCITCKKPVFWKDGDCGHFVTRNHPMTRFDERNCNAQCKSCNDVKRGDQYNHGFQINAKHGVGTADLLVDLGGIRGANVPHEKLALDDIAKEYRLKAKSEAKKKGIEL